MDHRSIIVFLRRKGLSAKAKAKDVHTELVQILGSDAIAYSTVSKNMWNGVIWPNESEARRERKVNVSRLQTIQF
jgi:hypothetical protein